MRLILARHGETSWNRERRNQGQNPTELNAQGIRQARNTAQSLRLFPIRALYSSPLRRAMQTSELIGQALSLPVIPRDGLMEMDLGRLDGLTNDEMTRALPRPDRPVEDGPLLRADARRGVLEGGPGAGVTDLRDHSP